MANSEMMSYSFKLEANPGKVAKLDALLEEWIRLVNEKIVELWPICTRNKFAPKEKRVGSRLISSAADYAWAMCKGAKRVRGSRPFYRGKSIDLDSCRCRLNFTPNKTSFDGWIDVSTLTPFARIGLPFRSYGFFEAAQCRWDCSKSVRLEKRKRDWYLVLFFKQEKIQCQTTRSVGIDVGYSIAAATSTGGLYGKDLDSLQRRTKRRGYRRICDKPYRQGLNRIAKQLIDDHQKSDFSVEKLHLSGKRRSALFRTRISRFAYQHLAQRLERLGQSKGFRVFYVDPAYTSQKCSQCDCVDKSNRNGDRFCCVKCGHQDHADVNAAINVKAIGLLQQGGALVVERPRRSAKPKSTRVIHA